MQWQKELIQLLDGGQAHGDIQSVIEGIPPHAYAKKVRNLPYTLWDLLEHIRLSQADILDYMTNPDYEAPAWPDDYWPTTKKPTRKMWEESTKQILRDNRKIKRLIKQTDPLKSVPSSRHTFLREILIVADHNAYHLGQMVTLRRLLGCFPD